MILFVFFIFFLLLENLFLPALIGPKTFLISPLFLAGLIIYGKSTKIRLIQVCIFLLLWEIFSGFKIGSFVIPFGITAGIYIWLNHFLNISSGLEEGGVLAGLVGGALTMTAFVYTYSWLFIFLNSSYNLAGSWYELITLVTSSILPTVGWSIGLVILFKYALRPK